MASPSSKSPHGAELQRKPQHRVRCYGGKISVLVFLSLTCIIVITKLSMAIESTMGQEVTGFYSIFATPTTDLHLDECPVRVSSQQAYLFTKNTYSEFFEKTHVPNVRVDSTPEVCKQGFHGNPQSYGLGVRWGQYSLWLSTVVATQAQLRVANMLLHATVAFQLANIANVFFMTFSRSCVFSVEVMIVLFLFIGGGSLSLRTPQVSEDTAQPKWTGISLPRILFHVTSFIVTLYQAWYWIWGFYGKFVEMPCGAFDFLGLPANDSRFRFWRIYMGLFSILHSIWLLMSIICSIFLFSGEFRKSVHESYLYTKIYCEPHYDLVNDQIDHHKVKPESRSDIISKDWYQRLRERFAFLRSGLFESFVVSRRTGKFVNGITIGTVKLVCVVIAAALVENTIKVNRISGVQNLDSVGQWLAFAVGVSGLLTCVYSFMRSEPDHPLPNNEKIWKSDDAV